MNVAKNKMMMIKRMMMMTDKMMMITIIIVIIILTAFQYSLNFLICGITFCKLFISIC